MKKSIFQQVSIFLYVSVVTLVAYSLYYGSRFIPNHPIHQIVAMVSGLVYFLSIFVGPFVICVLFLKGIPRLRQILITILIPYMQ